MIYDIVWLDKVDSTNSETKRRMDSLSDLSVISAHAQTAGRGQGDHVWLSEPGLNLTFSIALKYGEGGILGNLAAANQSVINEMISKTILELLSDYGIEARIKWPNDIYVSDKKICGILIEHSVMGASLVHSIIGVGLNVNQTVFDESLPNPTSMLLETKSSSIDLKALLNGIMDKFCKHSKSIHL